MKSIFQIRLSRQNRLKALVFCAVFLAFAALFAFDVFQYFQLDFLKGRRSQLAGLYEKSPLLTLAGFFCAYVLAAGLSIPAAAPVLSLAGGFLFGLFIGTAAVSLASSAGATAAFLMSRFLFRDLAKKTFSSKWESLERHLQKEGGWHLLSLRLFPAMPFFAVNILMGLSSMPAYKFFLISQIGMLPATVVYANAGARLAHVESMRDVFSPALALSFLALALLPLTVRAIRRAAGKAPPPGH